MKKYFISLCLILFTLFLPGVFSIAQQEANDRVWSVIKIQKDRSRNILPDVNWVPAPQVPVILPYATVGPNIRPKPGTNTTQSELSIDVHPGNKDIIFGSSNATNWPVTSLYGTGVYWSLNGSASWTGFDSPPFGSNRGDPVSVIGPDGKFYENYISSTSGQGVSVSTNNGANWTNYVVTPNPGYLADKNHYMVDKKTGSPYVNRSYCAWTDFEGVNNNQVVIRYSTNFGAAWSSIINLSSSLNPLSHAQGVNIQTGPNGEVYAVYAIYDGWPGGEDAIGFSKSTNGGVTWTHARVYSAANFGIRGNLSGKQNIRVSSFPSMAVDRSGGPYNGSIYITWPQIAVSPAGSDPDIVLIRSTNGGTTWTSPVRINNDPLNNGKDQYYPWCTVDQATGRLMLVFYDSRNVPNSQAEVYMANSTDGGATFENFKVSDQAHTPAPISGLADGYAGDYIGVAALDNVAYPYWADNRTGNYQAWTAKVTYGLPCPVNNASNPVPINNAVNVPAGLSQLTWTNGSGATQCEVWFGLADNMNMVYSGSLINNWSITGPLNYNQRYSWMIVGKNDTCSVSIEPWSFTTEPNPGQVFQESFTNMNFWTPIGPLGTTNWSVQSTANAGGTLPELRLNWSPEFNGLSKLRSGAISVQNNRHYSIELKHMLDYYASPAPNMGLGVSYDNGATFTPVWNITPTGNVGPATVTASFITPADDSPESLMNMYLVIFCNGNSYNLDYWYVDNIILFDDDFLVVNNPSNLLAEPVNESLINISFTPNTNNHNVLIAWNLTGIFTTPAGVPPAAGQPFAGGTLLYNGTASPAAHTGLNPSTTYYYKAFSYANPTYSSGVEVNASTLALSTFQLTVNISSEWNIVSIPGLHPVNQNVGTWWNGRDPGAGVFKFGGGYQAVSDVEPGTGYWMKHIGAKTYNTGDEWPAGGILFVPHLPITASEGWNLFGGYEQTVPAAGITTSPPGLLSGPVYRYQGGYVEAIDITPGHGYWAKLTGAGQIIIPSGSDAYIEDPDKEFKNSINDFGKIIFTDNAGKSYALYTASPDADLSRFELPPLPPQGMFDIRYSSHRFAERISSTPKLIEMSGVEYPVTIKAEKTGIILSDETGREVARLKQGEEFILSTAVSKLYALENVIPREYSLEQNYPNPFNPSTTIQFSIPEDVKNVKLIIFNSLGEELAELVNSELQSGYYQYTWNAGNMASGIYLYQIITEKFSAAKKMLLIK